MTAQWQFAAVGGNIPHYDLLRPRVVQQWEGILEFCSGHWGDEAQRERIERVGGCLDKLSASLLQVHRMRSHHNELVRVATEVARQGAKLAAFRGETAIADFENLLLQGRSALDRLTWFLTGEFGQKSSSFRSLRKVLATFAHKRPDAAVLIEVLDQSLPWFDSVFARIDSPETLRDLVGHKHAALEGVRTCFAVAFLDAAHAILFDCEIQLPGETGTRAIFRLSRDSGQHISSVILNCLSALIGQPHLALMEFETSWENRTVALSDFALKEPDGSPLGENTLTVVKRMTPVGFQITTQNFDPAIRMHAVDVTTS